MATTNNEQGGRHPDDAPLCDRDHGWDAREAVAYAERVGALGLYRDWACAECAQEWVADGEEGIVFLPGSGERRRVAALVRAIGWAS